MYHMLYAKGPNDKRFAPLNYKTGMTVGNVIRATMFNAAETEKIRADLPATHDANPGWSFELRECG